MDYKIKVEEKIILILNLWIYIMFDQNLIENEKYEFFFHTRSSNWPITKIILLTIVISISRNGLLKSCAKFIIERSEIRKK